MKKLYVIAKTYSRGEEFTEKFSIKKEELITAINLQGQELDTIYDAFEYLEDELSKSELLVEIATDSEVTLADLEDGFNVELEETTYGIGTTKEKAIMYLSQVDCDDWDEDE